MNTISIITAASFGLTGILICAVICRIFYEALVGPRKSWAESWKIRQKEKQLQQLESLSQSADLATNFKLLRQILHFDVAKYDSDLLERISSLNFSVLARFAQVAEARQANFSEIEVLEGLFSSRTALLRSASEVLLSKNNLLRKRNNQMPSWAFDEYKKKLEQLSEQLDTNKKSIEMQLDRLFKLLSSQKSQVEEIIYH